MEALLVVAASDDLGDEVEEGGLVHQLQPIVGGVGEQVLHSRPALADTLQYDLGAGAVGNVGRREVDHQEPPVGVDGDVALAARDLLARVIAPLCAWCRGHHRLAVDHTRRRGGLSAGPLAVRHQRQFVDGLEQEPARQLPERAIDRLPRPEMDRQHPPAAARTDQITHGVDHLAELHLARPPATPGLRHQRRDLLPFLVRQVGRVALGLLGDLGHPATALLCPHPKLESHSVVRWNSRRINFQNGL